METLEAIKARIKTSQDLLSVVKTMKALAAVSIRQFEKASASLAVYNRALELGLQAVLAGRGREAQRIGGAGGDVAAVVFGSDQGMCGQFNDQVAAWADKALRISREAGRRVDLWVLGGRAAPSLRDRGWSVAKEFPAPGSVGGIALSVQELALSLESWATGRRVYEIHLVFNRPTAKAAFSSQARRLLPPDPSWFDRLSRRDWPTRCLPAQATETRVLLPFLVRQLLHAGLFQAMADSLAGENAARLAAMQMAEKNIDEMREHLVMDYNQQRQTAITEELLDIVSGFEAITGET